MEWHVASRADVRGALFGGLWMSWCHSQAAAPNWLVPAISRVGRLGVMEVTDWVVGLTAHKFDGGSNSRYNCPDRTPTVLHVRVPAWVRVRARARLWARLWVWARMRARVPMGFRVQVRVHVHV